MADLVSTLVVATKDTNLSHKVHVVLHDLKGVLRGTPRAIFPPLTDAKLNASHAFSC